VGWGTGEDEVAGAILKVVEALGIFFMPPLCHSCERRNPGVGGVKRMVAGCWLFLPCRDAREKRRPCHPVHVGVTGLVLVLLACTPLFGFSDHSSIMKRRQQGILTGMPFMANVATRTFVDDTGRKLYLSDPPTRVISLMPSITEMVFAIGAGDAVIGVTQWCDYPPEARTRAKVGDMRPNIEAILALEPDLVLAVDAVRNDALETLRRLKIPLFIMNTASLEHVYAHMQTLGRMFRRVPEANAMVHAMRAKVQAIVEKTRSVSRPRVLYVLSERPFISVARGSFVHQILELAGADNIAKDAGTAWPRLSMEVVLQKDPEILLLPPRDDDASAGSGTEQWTQWSTLTAVKHNRVHFIPRIIVNRPGPRLVQGLAALARLIHPELFQED